MKWSIFTLRLCLSMLLFTNTTAKFRKEKDKGKMPPKVTEFSNNTNLCTIEGNSTPFHCFCSEGTTAFNNVTKAKCWVFNGLTHEHNLWTLFATQPLITELNVMVTQVGQLTFVPTKGLQYLKELQILTIVYGSINDIHPYAFANLTKVYDICLARNRIITLSNHAFAHLTNLSVLDLNENRISELSRGVFVDLPHLKKLSINKNNLSFIQESTFRHLGHLVELELGTNCLSVITKDTFAGLGELKKLDLRYNKIVMLGDLTFAELWVLEEMDLESNQIEFISERAFAGLTHLWRLNLRHNKLMNLRSTLLDGVPSITYFDLRHNNLETLTFDNIKPILQNFYNESGKFFLAENNFVCDCRLAWMYLLRNDTKNQFIRNILDDLMCHLETDDDQQIAVTSLPSTKSEFINIILHEEEPSLNPEYANVRPTDSEYYDEDEEDYQQQESLQNEVKNSQLQDITLRHLTRIPPNSLPCVEEPNPSTQTPEHFINTPAYAEINANRCSTNTYSVILSFSIAILRYFTKILYKHIF